MLALGRGVADALARGVPDAVVVMVTKSLQGWRALREPVQGVPDYDLWTPVSCIEVRQDGSPCYGSSFVFDPRGRGMLCREHALAPLERAFGQRPDLEEKAELVLRFLSLPSQHRHEILENLSAHDRREVIDMARVFNPEDGAGG